MPLTRDETDFIKGVYQKLGDRPLQPGDPLYQPVYEHSDRDPVKLLFRDIEFAETESLNLFSGFRGSGKTTELFRLRKQLEESDYLVLYANALDFINPASPIEIPDLLIVLAGAFAEALEKQGIKVGGDSYWTRIWNWLKNTVVEVQEVDFKTELAMDPVKAGAHMKLELRTTPTFRQKLATTLSGRVGELHGEVMAFFEDGVKAIRRSRGTDKRIVFLFDSLEQIRGSLTDEEHVTRSVGRVFSNYRTLLEIPYVHVVYTVPPWLKFVQPGLHMVLLQCVRMWEREPGRAACEPGIRALESLVEKRFTSGGLVRFFGPAPFKRLGRLIDLCGGHFRDLLLLVRETILRADSLPVADSAMDNAILSVRSDFLPISLDDAQWLAEIEREKSTLLKTREPSDVARLTYFLDTHLVLYLRNGEEWYDIHPLIRDEVAKIAASNAQ